MKDFNYQLTPTGIRLGLSEIHYNHLISDNTLLESLMSFLKSNARSNTGLIDVACSIPPNSFILYEPVVTESQLIFKITLRNLVIEYIVPIYVFG